MKTPLFFYLSLIIGFISCQENTNNYQSPYQLKEPHSIRQLPKMLKEVSGLSLVNSNQLACIQDEAGIIYIYNWKEDKITKKIDFGVMDDFEGIEIIDGDGFALTSEGAFYQIPALNGKPIIKNIDIGKSANFEGLGYQTSTNQFLLTPKEELEKGKLFIFSYDLNTAQIKSTITLTNKDVKRFCEQKNIKYNIPKKEFPFAPSGIAEHPITKNLYIVASSGKTLCILSPIGQILHIEKLNKKLFPQPEGITFFKNGDMIIASEGEKHGRLVQFKIN